LRRNMQKGERSTRRWGRGEENKLTEHKWEIEAGTQVSTMGARQSAFRQSGHRLSTAVC
jgi:hypothetical protein